MTMADINYEALVEVFKGNLWEAEWNRKEFRQ